MEDQAPLLHPAMQSLPADQAPTDVQALVSHEAMPPTQPMDEPKEDDTAEAPTPPPGGPRRFVGYRCEAGHITLSLMLIHPHQHRQVCQGGRASEPKVPQMVPG